MQQPATSGVGLRRVAEFQQACSSEPSFRAWYEGALPRVYGFVQGRTAGDSDLAPEITQQAFVAALRSRRQFDGSADPVVWICSIARNATADAARTEMGPGIRDYRSIAGLGDAAANYYQPPWLGIYVLHGRDIVSIGASTNGVLNALTPAQMEAIARIALTRLP